MNCAFYEKLDLIRKKTHNPYCFNSEVFVLFSSFSEIKGKWIISFISHKTVVRRSLSDKSLLTLLFTVIFFVYLLKGPFCLKIHVVIEGIYSNTVSLFSSKNLHVALSKRRISLFIDKYSILISLKLNCLILRYFFFQPNGSFFLICVEHCKFRCLLTF